MHDCNRTAHALHRPARERGGAGLLFPGDRTGRHIRSFYDQLIEPNVRIEDGYALLPEGPGLGVRLNPELFARGRGRVSRGARSDLKKTRTIPYS